MSNGPKEDPIIAEVRAARAAIWERCNRDMHTLFEYLRAKHRASGQRSVSVPPKPVERHDYPEAPPKDLKELDERISKLGLAGAPDAERSSRQ